MARKTASRWGFGLGTMGVLVGIGILLWPRPRRPRGGSLTLEQKTVSGKPFRAVLSESNVQYLVRTIAEDGGPHSEWASNVLRLLNEHGLPDSDQAVVQLLASVFASEPFSPLPRDDSPYGRAFAEDALARGVVPSEYVPLFEERAKFRPRSAEELVGVNVVDNVMWWSLLAIKRMTIREMPWLGS